MSIAAPSSPYQSVINSEGTSLRFRSQATSSRQTGLPGLVPSQKPCQYLKARGANILNKLIAMATCSSHSKSMVVKMKEELSRMLPMTNTSTPSDSPPPSSSSLPLSLLSCSTCQGHMIKPVCLPCGHSHCLSCIERMADTQKQTITCSRCQEGHPRVPMGFQSSRQSTFILQTVLSKHCPAEMSLCCEERERGNEFAQSGNFETALVHYNRAMETGKEREGGREGERGREREGGNTVHMSSHTPHMCLCKLVDMWWLTTTCTPVHQLLHLLCTL